MANRSYELESIIENEEAPSQSQINKLKSLINDFTGKYHKLESIKIDYNKYPELEKERLKLLKNGANLKTKIMTAQTLLPGFGVVPLVFGGMTAIAVIALSYAVVQWINEADTFENKIRAVINLNEKGIDYNSAERIVSNISNSGSIFDGLSSFLALGAVIGGFAYFSKRG